MTKNSRVWRVIASVWGLGVDFPAPEADLRYHRWSRTGAILAWLAVGVLFLTGWYGMVGLG